MISILPANTDHRMQCPTPSADSSMPRPRVFFGIAVITGILFALWTILVYQTGSIEGFDESCAKTFHDMAQQKRWTFMVTVTELGGVAAMILLTAVGACWQASLGNRLVALGWIAVMVGCGVLNSGSKHFFDRERPPEAMRDRSVIEVNRSYPSGHAMGSVIGYGMLAYCLFLWLRCWQRRTIVVLAIVLVVAAVGFSRIYLRAHWFSDVIAGWTLGLTWLFLGLTCIEDLRIRRM
jgi:undecaprenyl-diphosphatase